MVLTPQCATPRCTATVDLLSKYFRPYNFRVTVRGEPPHPYTMTIDVAAPSEDDAAAFGMQMFVKKFMPKAIADEMAPLAPTSKRI
jgi:hypothetical protein